MSSIEKKPYNELGINTATNTKQFSMPLTIDNKEYDLRFIVSVRMGFNADMKLETVKHYLRAVQILSKGGKDAGDGWDKRSQYADPICHSESRVNIFGLIPVKTPSGLLWETVNIFNEFSTAQELVNFMWVNIDADNAIRDWHSAINIVAERPRMTNGQQSITKANTAPTANLKEWKTPWDAPSNDVADESESIIVGAYDYKEKESYAGKTIKVDIMKMKRVFDQLTGEPCVQAYSSYNGSVSKYPAHDLKVKQNRLEKVDEMTRPILRAVLDGKEDNSQYLGTYFCYNPEPGKIYPLLTKLELVTGNKQPKQQQEEVKEFEYSEDEIPF